MTATNTSTVASPTPTSSARAVWQIALAEYERTKAESEQAVAAYNEAEKAYFGERKGGIDYAEAYGLRAGQTEAERFRAAEFAIIMRDHRGKEVSPELLDAVEAEATKAVADFAAMLIADEKAHQRHNLAALDKAVFEAGDAASAAEAQLYATPAPDADAMLHKLDILTAKMVECCENDAESVTAIRDDARRLFGSK